MREDLSPIVIVASAGRNMAYHRALDTITACGLTIGPAWIRSVLPHDEVQCRDCRETGRIK